MGSIVAELAEKISSATNNFSVDAQVLYVDTVNDEVGVNTTTPDGAFSIHQSGTDDIFNLYDGTDNITTVVDGGGLTHKGTLTVGVDDTGHDVKFYGATSGKSWVWDESADKMTVNGTTELIGNTLIGGITTAETIISGTPKVQVEGLGYADSSLSLFNNANDTLGAYLYLGKSRGTALSADTIIQDGDTVGGISFVAADGTDRASAVAGIFAVIDGTPGANDTPGEMTFYTTADGANSGTQKMAIKANGNVGIGVTDPNAKLQVGDSCKINTSLGVGTDASGTTGEIRATNNVTAYYSSDIALKENISPIGNALDKLSQISGVEFDWTKDYIDDHGGEDGYFVRKHDVGVIAQEIKKVLPEVVAERQDGTLAVRYEKIIALLIEAVKELKGKLGEK